MMDALLALYAEEGIIFSCEVNCPLLLHVHPIAICLARFATFLGAVVVVVGRVWAGVVCGGGIFLFRSCFLSVRQLRFMKSVGTISFNSTILFFRLSEKEERQFVD